MWALASCFFWTALSNEKAPVPKCQIGLVLNRFFYWSTFPSTMSDFELRPHVSGNEVTQQDVWVTLGEHYDSYKYIVRVESMIENSFFFCSYPLKYLAWKILSCFCPTLVITLKRWRCLQVSNTSGVELYLLIHFQQVVCAAVHVSLPASYFLFSSSCLLWFRVLHHCNLSVVLLSLPSFYGLLCSRWF